MFCLKLHRTTSVELILCGLKAVTLRVFVERGRFLRRPRKIKSVLFEIIFSVADKPIYDKR